MQPKNKLPTKILLVDDDEEDYIILRRLLANIPNSPFELSWTSDYRKAEKNIKEAKYNVYLIDYRLGKYNGLRLLQSAEPTKRAEPFILLTGAGDEHIEREAMKLGAADYLVKGKFSSELLSRCMRYALARKKVEQQRIKHLVALNKTKDEFISLASHQLRTPATGVKQYVGMVLEGFAGKISGRQKDMLYKAYESNERQLAIINDLLKVAQVDSGNLTLHRVPVGMVSLIEDVIREQQLTTEKRRQKVIFKSLQSKEINAFADIETIRMVIENILDNASKYSEHGKSIKVVLEIKNDMACIQISDQGVGVKRADRSKLFQKFSRIENPLSTVVGGTGLGLYWAKRIVDLHGGYIKFESGKPKGVVVTISLPL